MGPVNSFTEWGRLEEVILGSHFNTTVGQLDVSMEVLFHDNFKRLKRKFPEHNYTIKKEYIDEREEDTTALADLLTSLGIRVRRPRPPDGIKRIVTPYWEALAKACDNPRDQVMVVGDRLIETPPCVRSRYFENDLLKPIFYDYFAQGARWISAPRPMLAEGSFDLSYVHGTEMAPTKGMEILFDAAQCLRFGKDILFNAQTRNHELGLEWLRRELGDAFRIHRVAITDNHLDGAIMPLRPGKLLICDKALGKLHLLPEPLQKWDVLYMTDEDQSAYAEEDLLLASSRINVNVLSIDEERVIVNENATKTIRVLERHGFTPIPVRFRHSRIFGGGLHCVSVDVCRRENLEDYFG